MQLEQALAQLDPANDDCWTADGLPRMDMLAELTGDRTIKRSDVTALASELTRDTAPPIETAPVPPEELEEDLEDEEGEDLEDLEDEEEEFDEDEDEEEAESEELDEEDPANEPDELTEELPPEPPALVDPEVDLAADDVLDMPATDVVADYALTVRAIAAIDRKTQDALRRKTEIEEELRQLSAKNDFLTRCEVAHLRRDKTLVKTNPIREYLAAQAKARAERTARARKFIEAGTTAKDVARELSPVSPLDAAMKHKRGQRGRPSRLPVNPRS